MDLTKTDNCWSDQGLTRMTKSEILIYSTFNNGETEGKHSISNGEWNYKKNFQENVLTRISLHTNRLMELNNHYFLFVDA